MTLAKVADHVVPHRGDDELFWDGDLQSLCVSCHSRHKQRYEKSGRMAGARLDGTPVDKGHHWNKGGGKGGM